MGFTALLLVGTALAGGGRHGPIFEEERTPPSVSLTVSPLSLMNRPVLEGAAEFRVADTRSFSITGSRPMGPITTVPSELGLQVREYVAGDFGNGLALGAKASFRNPEPLRLRADSTVVGPFLAAKITLAIFTVEARGGPEFTIGGKQGIKLTPAVDLSAGISF